MSRTIGVQIMTDNIGQSNFGGPVFFTMTAEMAAAHSLSNLYDVPFRLFYDNEVCEIDDKSTTKEPIIVITC